MRKTCPAISAPSAEHRLRAHRMFTIVQRKVLTPNDFPCLEAVAERLANFERYFETIAQPFEWKFTRADLNALIARMRSRYAETQHLKLAA